MFSKIIATFLSISLSALTSSQPYKQWPGMLPGPFGVGFKAYQQYDYGRHVLPDGTDESEPQPTRPKQLAIYVWYPAKNVAGTKPMLYHDYACLTKQANVFKPVTPALEKAADSIIRFIVAHGDYGNLGDDAWQAIAAAPVAAVKNAVPAAGKFPVIVCGIQGGPSLNNVLFEYLASKGYVVVASAGGQREGRMEAFNPQQALLERMEDIEYVTAFVHTLPFADGGHTGVLGVNFEGLTAIVYQMKNQHALAIASIDGWEGKVGSLDILKSFVCYDSSKFTIPYFAVMQHENPPPQPGLVLTTNVFDSVARNSRYYYVLNGFSHAWLVAGLYMLPGLPAEKRNAYRFLYEHIGYFFDAYVKHNKQAVVMLQQPPAESLAKTAIIKPVE